MIPARQTPPETGADAALAQYAEDGYLLFPSVLSAEELARVRAPLDLRLSATPDGRNAFEGRKTRRAYGLLADAPETALLAEHPRIVSLADRLLGPNYLLSAFLAIDIGPDEAAQPWHYDDGFYRVPRPRPAYSVSAIWALDAFTDDNGATELIPGSHLWADEEPSAEPRDAVRAAAPAGSLLLFSGALWHRGGANRSSGRRLAVSPQYCEAWCRQQENMIASTGAAAAALSPRLQAMLGYSIHPPFMGHVRGMHPLRLIDPGYRAETHEDARIAARLLEGDGTIIGKG